MADEADRLSGTGDYADDAAAAKLFDSDEPPVALVRPFYHAIYANLSMSQAVTMSAEGTCALGIGRDGFTYGETSLGSVWRVLQQCDVQSYACKCPEPASLAVRSGEHGQECWRWNRDSSVRCERCALRPAGAILLDVGSGVGNVLVGAALLEATGRLDGPLSELRGVEKLPTLHAAAVDALERLTAWGACTAGPGLVLPRPLPSCTVSCEDLEECDHLAQADIVYMASTVFEDALLERFAQRAAACMRPRSRVVTLAAPLRHPAFRAVATVPCVNCKCR